MFGHTKALLLENASKDKQSEIAGPSPIVSSAKEKKSQVKKQTRQEMEK